MKIENKRFVQGVVSVYRVDWKASTPWRVWTGRAIFFLSFKTKKEAQQVADSFSKDC